MKPRKILITALLLNIIMLSCGSSQKVYNVGQYNSSQVKANDFQYADSKLGYKIYQDKSHLSMVLIATDRSTQIKILQNGVITFFDKKGKKNKDVFVQYPIGQEKQTQNLEEMKKWRKNPQEMMTEKIKALGTDILIGRNDERRVINKVFNDEDISVDYQMSPEGLVYTLKVPLTYLENDSNIQSIGIAINGMQMPEMGNRPTMGMRPSGGSRGGGMRGGGRSGGKGSRGSGQGSRPDMSLLEDLQSRIEIWIPIKLK